MPPLPRLIDWMGIQTRLRQVFPAGSPNRPHCVWDISAKTIYVMLYIGAVEDRDVWLRPDQVTRMTDQQANMTGDSSRREWARESLMASRGGIAGRWYAVNTRESIRDDSIRNALIPNGVVVERQGLATTSPAPRYALQADFASLLDPELRDDNLRTAIENWQSKNLTAGARARIAIWRSGAVTEESDVLVRFPNGETRHLASGQSSFIAKSVIEDFAPRYLRTPVVLWLSESRNKVVARDDELARRIGLRIDPSRSLPDMILADIGREQPAFVFVEVVATDGAITPARKEALTRLAKEAGFSSDNLYFVTAYLDRSDSAFKKTIASLAWGTFAWFATEPANLIECHDSRFVRLAKSPIQVSS